MILTKAETLHLFRFSSALSSTKECEPFLCLRKTIKMTTQVSLFSEQYITSFFVVLELSPIFYAKRKLLLQEYCSNYSFYHSIYCRSCSKDLVLKQELFMIRIKFTNVKFDSNSSQIKNQQRKPKIIIELFQNSFCLSFPKVDYFLFKILFLDSQKQELQVNTVIQSSLFMVLLLKWQNMILFIPLKLYNDPNFDPVFFSIQ